MGYSCMGGMYFVWVGCNCVGGVLIWGRRAVLFLLGGGGCYGGKQKMVGCLARG